MTAILLGDDAPDFTAESTTGPIAFHSYLGNGWGILFFHPAGFSPVSTTELGAIAKLIPELARRNTRVVAVCVDPIESLHRWLDDIEDVTGARPAYPLVADPNRAVATSYGMIHSNASTSATVRSVFVVGPDKKVKLTLSYPASTGCDFSEILRVLDSLQLTAYQVATPADWRVGDDVIITTAITDEDAALRFPGYTTVKPYLRTTAQPG